MYIIYCLTSPSGKKYVGQTECWRARWAVHIGDARRGYGGCRVLRRAIRRYGAGSFTHEILETVDSLEDANAAEIRWIKDLDCLAPNGYNLNEGGNKRNTHESTRSKLSATHKRLSSTPKERARLSAIQKATWVGLTLDERRRRLAKAHEATRRKIAFWESKRLPCCVCGEPSTSGSNYRVRTGHQTQAYCARHKSRCVRRIDFSKKPRQKIIIRCSICGEPAQRHCASNLTRGKVQRAYCVEHKGGWAEKTAEAVSRRRPCDVCGVPSTAWSHWSFSAGRVKHTYCELHKGGAHGATDGRRATAERLPPSGR